MHDRRSIDRTAGTKPRPDSLAASCLARGSALGPLALCAAVWLSSSPAQAQDTEIRYAEEPTGGLDVPAAALAGEHDAYSVVKNPAGMMFTGGFAAGLGLHVGEDDDATTAGPGVGLYLANITSGRWLPRLGYGIGVEFLQPSRQALDPDPGAPTRLTLAGALPIGSQAALGLSWHRMFDDPGRATRNLSSLDLGVSARLGARLGFGAVVRDVNAPVADGVPVQRRYELELITRPLATDRLELALGGLATTLTLPVAESE